MKRTGAFLLILALMCLLTSCGFQAIHTYDYNGKELVVDVDAGMIQYDHQDYTYVWSRDSWSITWPGGEYYQETQVSPGNSIVSSSWDYGETPEAMGYLSQEVLTEYIEKAEGTATIRYVILALGIVLTLLGCFTMIWPDWLVLLSHHWIPEPSEKLLMLERVAGGLIAFCGLGLIFTHLL